MGFSEKLLEMKQDLRVKTQLVDLEDGLPFVQDSQDNFLTVNARHGRKSKIYLAAIQMNLDPTVLRNPSFGNVKIRHHFEPGDHGRMHLNFV